MTNSDDVTRRDVVKMAGTAGAAAAAVAITGFPAIQKAPGANDPIQFGMIGTGSRGTYLLKHLVGIDNGRCVALCDLQQDQIDKGIKTIGGSPKIFKDYREMLAAKDVDAVLGTT